MAHAHGSSESCLRCLRPVGGTHTDLCPQCLQQLRENGLSPAELRQLYERQHERPTSSLVYADTIPDPLLKYMASKIEKSSLILEVGSGGGHLGVRLAEEGLTRMICSDHTGKAVSVMRRRGLPRVVCLDAAHLPFVDAVVDAVISIEVLEHLQDVGAHIREVARVLRPGGTYIIKTPNKLIASVYYRLTGHHDIEIWHPSTLSAGDLNRILKAEGFEPTYLPTPLSGSQLRKLPAGALIRRLAALIPWNAIPKAIRPSLVCVAMKRA